MSELSEVAEELTVAEPVPTAQVSRRADLTEGSISRNLWRLALPMMTGNTLSVTFYLVNMFWVSRLGSTAIAAVTFGGTVLQVIFTIVIGMNIATTAMVARFIGAKEPDKAEQVAGQSLLLSTLVSAILVVLGLRFAPGILAALGAEPDVVAVGTGYLKICLLGAVTNLFLMSQSSILQGAGDAVTPLIVTASANVLNFILDPLMIFGIGFPRMGVNGAAVASVLCQALGAAACFHMLIGGRARITVRAHNFKPSLRTIWRILRLAIPNSTELSLRSLSFLALTRIVAIYGTFAVAAFGVFNRLIMMLLLPAIGMASATATLVGQNLGAKKPERALRSVLLASAFLTIILVAFSLVFMAFAEHFISFFDHQPEVVEVGKSLLKTASLGLVFIGLAMVYGRALNGAGDMISPLFITIVSLWMVQVPLALYLPQVGGLGVKGIWWAMVAANFVGGVCSPVWFSTGKWKTKRV